MACSLWLYVRYRIKAGFRRNAHDYKHGPFKEGQRGVWLLGFAPQGGLLSAHLLRYVSCEGPRELERAFAAKHALNMCA